MVVGTVALGTSVGVMTCPDEGAAGVGMVAGVVITAGTGATAGVGIAVVVAPFAVVVFF